MGHSDTSSERSDTPNSFIANSNYFGNFSFAFDGFFPNETTALDSSGSSTSTTVFAHTDKDDVQTPKKVSDNEEEKAKSTSPKSNKKTNEPKRDSSYCGYVESFPYYYKLNRLYNALALQKMQTERLKKAGLLSQSNVNNPVAVAQAFAAYQSMNVLGSSPTGAQMASSSPPKSKHRNFKNNKKYSHTIQQQKNF